MTTDYDLIVVGEGCAGLTCAREAAGLGLEVATFEAAFFGGPVLNLGELQRFDEAAGMSGMDYAAMLANASAEAGVVSTNAPVAAVRTCAQGFEVETAAGTRTARAVVIASGARPRALGIPGEESFEGRGISRCADCDGPMFAGARVVVAGANEWAVHEALVLARTSAVVYLVHEGGELDALPESIEQVHAQPNIERLADTRIEEILGDESGVTAVRVRGPAGAHRIDCSGVFPFVGLTPNSEMASAEVRRDSSGAIEVDANLETSVPGLFAVGNVRAGAAGWLGEAVADARRAAHAVKARLGASVR